MIIVKTCGMMRSEDIACVNRYKPDWVGFVFARGRRRTISPDRAMEFKKMLDPAIRAVGVFVNEEIDTVVQACERGIIDMIQLHGSEDEDYIKVLRKRTSSDIIKAVRVSDREDIQRANGSPADIVLLDHGSGGSGESFDWSLLSGMSRPFILAGGLSPENVGDALDEVRRLGVYGQLIGVDASSSLETDGYKDPEKIRAFVSAVK